MRQLFQIRICATFLIVSFLLYAPHTVYAENQIDSTKNILFLSIEFPSINLDYGILHSAKEIPKWDVQQKLIKEKQNWIFFLLLLVIAIAGGIKYFFEKFYQNLWRGFLSISLSGQLFNDNGNRNMLISLILNISFFIVLSLWVFLGVVYFNINLPFSGFQQWMLLFVLTAGVFMLKHLLSLFISFVFPFGRDVRFFSFSCWQLYKISGLVLIPFCFLIAFSPGIIPKITFYISLIILTVFIFIRILKGIEIANKYIYKEKFLLFLYVCTLEIAPILIFFRLMHNWQVF